MLAFCSACSILLTFVAGNYFFLFYFRIFLLRSLFSSIKIIFCSKWSMSENFFSDFHYYWIFKVKHCEKRCSQDMSQDFCSYITCWIFLPLNQAYCQTCVKRSLKSSRFGKVVFCETPVEGLLLMVLEGKMFFCIP